MTALIDANELAAAIAGGEAVVLLDVRWKLGGPHGRPLYRDGHIPGAVYVDLDTELSRHGTPEDGRHPLPTIEKLESSARAWGLREGQSVVVYDDVSGMSAARAWWLLRHAGVADVRLLDGGLAAWTAAGFGLEAGEAHPAQGDVRLDYGTLRELSMDETAALPGRGTLLDARSSERYRGEIEPIDPRAGHIPGAVSAPTTENLDLQGRFFPADVLAERFRSLGVSTDAAVGVYCGSGITAAHEALALTLAGFDPALYPGSWSQWSSHQGRPVATGPSPRGSSPTPV